MSQVFLLLKENVPGGEMTMKVKSKDGKFFIPVFFEPNAALHSLNKSLQQLFIDEVKLGGTCFRSMATCDEYRNVYERRDELNATGMVMMGNILVPIGGLGLANYIRALEEAGAIRTTTHNQQVTDEVVASNA